MPQQDRVKRFVACTAVTAALGGVWWFYTLVPVWAEATPIPAVPDLSDHPIYMNYEFGQDDSVIDLGTQPLWVPTCLISEVMQRDTVLYAALAEQASATSR